MMKTVIILSAVTAGMIAVAFAYTPPIAYEEAGDRVFTNAGQTLELQARTIDGKPNPDFHKYRNASPRVWLRNGDVFRVLVELNGEVINQSLGEGVASCAENKRQPLYVRVRLEDEADEPTEEVAEFEEVVR